MNRSTSDLAKSRHRDQWLHHPVVGDPSWDSFQREPGNPLYVGKEPYLWPVNGFLFRDPPTGRWYAYISLYPRGYWPPGGTLCLRERANGGWDEVGIVLQGDARSFDGDGKRPGGTVDVSIVYESGRYHMVYGWADPANERGGIAYAWAERPEGPFHRAPAPIHEDTTQKPLLGRYVRVYASTLIRRRNDWLILHMMSTPHNAGGTWALACMTSRYPDRGYTPPQLLLYPQSDVFHPPLVEFFPAFVHRGTVYAPATSVALNRTFQVLFRAPVEKAHLPEAWQIAQYGSLWHAEAHPWEAQGIWGQTFAGQVAPEGILRVLFPSKTDRDIGTISLARRKWNQPFRDGFVLSAPRGTAIAVLRRQYRTFQLSSSVRSNGAWALCWQCANPLGSNHHLADSSLHPLTGRSRTEWRIKDGEWQLVRIGSAGDSAKVARGTVRLVPNQEVNLQVQQGPSDAELSINNQRVWTGNLPAEPGRLELLAEPGTVLEVTRFEVGGDFQPSTECWLATEALAGAASAPEEWKPIQHEHFRFGTGFVNATPEARAKWNFWGRGFRLYAPRAPQYGKCEILVDGRDRLSVDLYSRTEEPSSVVAEQRLAGGFHSVVVRPLQGTIPCDCLEVLV
jgi:hypothetical protein